MIELSEPSRLLYLEELACSFLAARCNVCKASIAKSHILMISTQPRHWFPFKRKVEGRVLVMLSDQDAQSAGLGNFVPKSLGADVSGIANERHCGQAQQHC